jgi:NADPH:quinone reductase-like Zn-dependent oxidoreductase
MTLAKLDDPVPGDDEVLIDVAAAAVNPIDWKIVSGAMKAFIPLPLPFTPGVDAAGTVLAVGRNVSTLAPGDEVMGFIGIVGAYASRIVVDPARLARKPARLSFTDAVATPAATLTAWQALHEHGELRKGQSVLIHAAAGGVGSAAVQLAKLAGRTSSALLRPAIASTCRASAPQKSSTTMRRTSRSGSLMSIWCSTSLAARRRRGHGPC